MHVWECAGGLGYSDFFSLFSSHLVTFFSQLRTMVRLAGMHRPATALSADL
jgi:hypothetical protein